MKQHALFLLLSLSLLWITTACEKEITVKLPQGDKHLVVEGYIENGAIPFISLTRDIAYFDKLSLNQLSNQFVKGAIVTVSDGTNSVQLDEWVQKVPSGTKGDSVEVVFYMGLSRSSFLPLILGEENKKYKLTVQAEGQTLVAETTIPKAVNLDSVYFEKVDSTNSPLLPDCIKEHGWSIYRLLADFQDPAGEVNYYRYWTSVEGHDSTGVSYHANIPSFLNSVSILGRYISNENSTFSVTFLDGQQISGAFFQLIRGGNDTVECGEFARIDTIKDVNANGQNVRIIRDSVSLKFAQIDKAQYDFWETFGNNITGNGPFSPPISVKSNIIGGLGIWGGTSAKYYRNLKIPK